MLTGHLWVDCDQHGQVLIGQQSICPVLSMDNENSDWTEWSGYLMGAHVPKNIISSCGMYGI